MAEVKLDCRGQACPQPVLTVKQAIESGEVSLLTITVDNAAAKENVGRFLQRSGYAVSVVEGEGVFDVTGTKGEEAPACEIMLEPAEGLQEGARKIAVLVGTDRMGRGDDELGLKLMTNFLGTIKEMGPELWRLIFVNAGVKLTVDDSPSLPALQGLEGEGILILVCGTCLNHYGLLERKRVGETTNMLDIVTALQLADKVITLS